MKIFFKTIFSLILITVIVFGVRELIFAQNESATLVSENKEGVNFSTQREILSLLLELKSIKLSGDLFQSNIFRSFKDFGVSIETQPVGRSNPFAPIGTDLDTSTNTNTDNGEDLSLDNFDNLGSLDDLNF